MEAACGTGCLTKYLCRLSKDVVGFDRSPEMLKIARKKTKRKNVKFYVNGTEIQTVSRTGNIDNSATTLDIGAGKTDSGGSNNEPFEGYIDEVKT